jgi:Ca2+-binding EF-hand superfamily protein
MAGVANMGGAGAVQSWSGASARMPMPQKMSNLFSQIDAQAIGSISKAQFQQAFQTMNPPASIQNTGVNTLWAKLDPSGSGSVSRQDFIKTMTANAQSASANLKVSTQALNALGSSTYLNTSA